MVAAGLPAHRRASAPASRCQPRRMRTPSTCAGVNRHHDTMLPMHVGYHPTVVLLHCRCRESLCRLTLALSPPSRRHATVRLCHRRRKPRGPQCARPSCYHVTNSRPALPKKKKHRIFLTFCCRCFNILFLLFQLSTFYFLFSTFSILNVETCVWKC